MHYLTELRARREQLLTDAERITTTAEAEGRARLSATEQAEVDAMLADIDAIDERIGELEAVVARQDAAARAGVPSTVHVNRGGDPWERARTASRSDLAGLAHDAIERSEAPDGARSRVVESIDAGGLESERMARWALSSSTPAYRSAFAKMLAHGEMAGGMLTPEESRSVIEVNNEARALSLTDSAGGYMVPFTLDPAIILSSAGAIDPMREIARQVTITTDTWNGVRSAGVTASWDAEASAVSDDSPTLAQPSITTYTGRVFIPYSIEVGMDAVNFQNEMQKLIADAFAVLEADAFWVGTGSGQPRGVITALDANTNVEVVVTTDGSFGQADIYKLIEQVPARFRSNASWAGDLTTLNKVRRFGEGTTGSNSAFWTDLGAGTPPLLLGKPVYEASYFPDFVSTTGAANLLVAGSFSDAYVIADRVGTTVELVPHLFDVTNNRPTGQRGLFAFRRTGADSVNDNALRLLQNQ